MTIFCRLAQKMQKFVPANINLHVHTVVLNIDFVDPVPFPHTNRKVYTCTVTVLAKCCLSQNYRKCIYPQIIIVTLR